mgnify:CR=1 FL=1
MDEAYPYSRNRDPKIPPGIDKPKGTQEEAMMYTYSQMPNAPGSLLEGQIYTYEVPKSTSEGEAYASFCKAFMKEEPITIELISHPTRKSMRVVLMFFGEIMCRYIATINMS